MWNKLVLKVNQQVSSDFIYSDHLGAFAKQFENNNEGLLTFALVSTSATSPCPSVHLSDATEQLYSNRKNVSEILFWRALKNFVDLFKFGKK